MIQLAGDLWSTSADVTVVTTNGIVRRDGSCVMGRGTAKQATERYPTVAHELGTLLKRHGNHCFLLAGGALASFPVKVNWKEPAVTSLITQSAKEIVSMADIYGWGKVAMPRPGCGNGGLDWNIVEFLLAWHLDDRFVIVERN